MPEWLQAAVIPGAVTVAFGLFWKFVGPRKCGLAVSKLINSKIGHKPGELLQKKLNEWIDAFQEGMNSDNQKKEDGK